MREVGFNASVRLAAWTVFVGLIQLLPWPALPICLAVLAWRGADVRRRWFHLVRRSRWLLLILAVSLALVTPGEYLLPNLPVTGEGVNAALHQVLRLLTMLGAVALLLASTPIPAIVGGLLGLLPKRPAAAARLSQRAALRLALVLQLAATSAPRPWRQWLDDPGGATDAIPSVTVNVPDWRAVDRIALLSLIALASLLAVYLPPGH